MLGKDDLYYRRRTLHEIEIPLHKDFYNVLSAIQGKQLLEEYAGMPEDEDEGEFFSVLSFRIDLNYEFDISFYSETTGFSIRLSVDDGKEGYLDTQWIDDLKKEFVFDDGKEIYRIRFIYDDEIGFSEFKQFSADEILAFYGLKETPLCPSCNCSILEEGVYIVNKERGFFDEEGYYTSCEDAEPVTCCANCEYEFDEDELCELLGSELKF